MRIMAFLALDMLFPSALLRWSWWAFLGWQGFGLCSALVLTLHSLAYYGGAADLRLLFTLGWIICRYGIELLTGWLIFSVARQVLDPVTSRRSSAGV